MLNELVARNVATYADPGGGYPDYVELYNPTDDYLPVTGYGLSDRADAPYRLRLDPASVPPRGHLLVLLGATGEAASFRLGDAGETVYLTDAAGRRVDSVAYPSLRADHAYARAGDGATAWGITDAPTPARPNGTHVHAGYAPRLACTYDPATGFAVRPLDPAADTAGLTLRYTLDGSEPTDDSRRLRGPMPTAGATVLRVRADQPGHLAGDVATCTHLPDAAAHTLPVVALTTDPRHLYGPVDGLWQLGPDADSTDPYTGANFYRDWARPGHVELWDARGRPVLADAVDLAVAGGAARKLPVKATSLRARNRYAPDRLPLGGLPGWTGDAAPRSLTLRASGQDVDRTHLRDAYAQALFRRTANHTLAAQPAAVYLNGAYYGLLHLRERADRAYCAGLLGVGADDVYLVERRGGFGWEPRSGDDAVEAYEDLMARVAALNLASDAALDSLGAWLDLDNLVDYLSAEVYLANRDWPGSNHKLFRAKPPGSRWRWILFDLDQAAGFDWHSRAVVNSLAKLLDSTTAAPWPNPLAATWLPRRVLRQPTLRRTFVNRACDLLNFHLRPADALALRDSLAAQIAAEVPRHRARWDSLIAFQPWPAALAALDSFAVQRPRHLREHYRAYFGLGADATVRVNASDPAGGTVRLHRERIRAFPWAGDYFAGTSIELEAEPAPGYRFRGWRDGTSGAAGFLQNEPLLRIDPAEAGALVAVFERAADAVAGVIVNEVNYNSPPDLPAADWVELHNPTAVEVPLGGYELRDGGDNAYVLPAGTSLPAGGYLVVARDPAAFRGVHDTVDALVGGFAFGFKNSGERVALYDDAGRVVDSFTYLDTVPWPPTADGDGPTLELRPDLPPPLDPSDPGNWQASLPRGGTPGARNSQVVGTRGPAADEVSLRAWPNPVTGGQPVWLDLPSGSGVARVTLHDATGRRIARWRVAGSSGDQARLLVPSLPAGVYLLRLGHHTARLVVR